jgi:hypothetical protein
LNERMPINAERAKNTAVTLAPSRLLRRKCACGGTPGPDGECEQCRTKRLDRQRDLANQTILSDVPPVVPETLHSLGQPSDGDTRAFMGPRFGHDFSRVRVYMPDRDQSQQPPSDRLGPGAMGTDRPILRLFSGKSDCSPTWFGDTSPELDPSGENFTGRLIVTYNDAALKDPCVRECVEVHENVHVEHLTPIVKRIHECDVAAGGDWDKKGKCNEMATRELVAVRARSECEAYRKSFTCLTLKVLDAKNPCSKPPHREEVQKHRGYEGCEMKRQCGEAGTPDLGVPNV